MTAAGRVLLWLCAFVVVLAPLVVGAALGPRVPVEWLAWVPLAAALLLSWFLLAPK